MYDPNPQLKHEYFCKNCKEDFQSNEAQTNCAECLSTNIIKQR